MARTQSVRLITLLLVVTLGGCASAPPENKENICEIFREKGGWYKDARHASNRWGAPIPVMMSFMYQESGFRSGAKPPRTKILWIIPGPRPASAKGYSQATNETWSAYKKATGQWIADRNDFDDAIDFMGWYIDQSYRRNRIAKDDAYNQYLAYHEGQGGYAKRTYRKKKWLLKTASTVQRRASMYSSQLKSCQKEFETPWFLRWLPFV
ncbi:MAG: transglycosylase SLT domain-containing protein [Pseudomonadales bacterium]|nr:transglycosylase SLT domain-containing protein [Pseudomonadales bacterium]